MSEAQRSAAKPAFAEWAVIMRSPLVVLAMALLLGVLALMYVQYRESERQAFDASVETLETLVFALSQHAESTFDNGDQILKTIRYAYRAPQGNLGAVFESHNAAIDRQSFPLEAVISANGKMYLSTTNPQDLTGAARVDLSDRSHYLWHRDGKDDEVFVSLPITGRVSGKSVLNMSRRIDDDSGKFSGVAVVSVSPDNFVDPYRSIIGDSGEISIFGRDGISRMRITRNKAQAPLDSSKSGSMARLLKEGKGHFVALSEIDGQPRLYAFRSLKKFPLIVVVGFGLRELEDQHDNGALSLASARAALVLLGMCFLIWVSAWSQILRRRLQAANALLEQAASDAALASRARWRLLVGISGHIGALVSGVAVKAQILALDAPTGAMREDAQRIFDQVQHLRKAREDLRDLGRAESGLHVMQWEQTNLNLLVHEVAESHFELARAKGLTTLVECDLPHDGQFVTDSACLKSVLHKVIGSVLAFSAQGQSSIRVAQVPEGLRFEVSGPGTGNSAECLADILGPYAICAKSQADVEPEVDLGLLLSKVLVECLGGKLWVTSQADGNTMFWFELPQHSDPSAPKVRRP